MAYRKPIHKLQLPQEYRYDHMTGVEEYRTRENGVWSDWTIWEDEPPTEENPVAVTRDIAQREMHAMHRAWADEIFGQEDDGSPMWVPPRSSPAERHAEAEAVNVLAAVDMVNLPEHYARFKIEPIRFIVENSLSFLQGNVIKYILRYDAKNGLEDLKKAQRYLAMLIAWVEGNGDWWKLPTS